MVVFNDQKFVAYLLWSDDRGGQAGKREPVLRQLFVRKEFRREGIGTAMVRTWADQFAFPIDVDGLFGVEDPNNDAQRILVKLGYAHIEGQTLVGEKCYFGGRPEQLSHTGTVAR